MTQIPQAIAWTLIHFCWQAAAIALAYRVISAVIARKSSQTRYLAALSGLLLMLVCAAGTFAWEMRSDGTPISIVDSTSNLRATIAADLQSTETSGPATTEPREPFMLAIVLPWIDGLWLIGVFALSVRSLGGWWYLRRLRLASTTEAPSAVRAAFQRISATLGLHRSITLRLTEAIDSPMTMGTLRAIVLLPLSAVTSLGPDELEVVLAHELAHVRRADFFWNILQTIAETLFFFHPAVWWISSRIRHERELCCDDLALEICPNPFAYANALVRLEEQRSRHLRLALALDGHQSHLTLLTRVARILGEPMTRIPSRRLRPFSLAAAFTGLVVLCFPVPHLLASLSPAKQADAKATVSIATTTAPIAAPVIATEVALHIADPAPSSPAIASAEPAPTPRPSSQSDATPKSSAQPHSDYIDQMKAAGYDVDLDKLIAMKIQNVTPEYAQAMAQAGFGKLSADDLIASKIQGVTPEAIAEMKKQGLEINNVHDAISFRIFQVTPEFISGMKAAGFENLDSKQLIAMRVQGVTPEYARQLKQKFPKVTADDLVKARIFRIDDEFMAQAAKHGFTNLPFDKLVQLRISGLLDDESVKE
ncbi:M56 family metallopeptidase [Telmatobacter sp. DSM 110680]|uniref:M56 family metallopeptidase n=1 Tax=Telmatobacter sp. DSM 110680 TaxID=3036704 RepID=A0AAU7DD33_9BACT